MAAPLTDLMKKGTNVPAVWTAEHDAAVDGIKKALTTYPCLRQFDPTQPVVLLVDASKVGLGGCMAQYHDGSLCPVSYSSHRLTKSERLYPITELEGLAILHTVRCHRHFLINNPFTVRCLTDHKPLTWVQKVNTASGRLARWMMELANYDFRIEYIPGKVNDVADALSRLQLAEPASESDGIEFRDYLKDQEVMSVDMEQLMQDAEFTADFMSADASLDLLGDEDIDITEALPEHWRGFVDVCGMDTYMSEVTTQHTLELTQRCNSQTYKLCPDFDELFHRTTEVAKATDRSQSARDESQSARDPSTPDEKKAAQSAANDTAAAEDKTQSARDDEKQRPKSRVPARMRFGMYAVNDALYTATGRLCVPASLRGDMMKELHENTGAMHRGRDQMLAHMQRRLYWPDMENDVKDYVAQCETCGESKASTHKHLGKLRPHMPPTGPFTHYSVDFMFGFPKDGGGPLQYDGIMVVVDQFSKRVIAIPVWESAKAETMAEQFMRAVVCKRGVPLSIVSDRDSRFCGAFWRKLWALHRTSLKMTPAYSPQADGQTERMNRLLQEIMRTNVQADQLNWLELLDGAVMTINNAVLSEGGKSPFELETGTAMRLPIDTQPLMDQTWQNRGCGQMVRDTMQYGDDGQLLDVAPYPAIYEYAAQQKYEYDHPERMRAIHQLAREQMVQAKLRMADKLNEHRPDRVYEEGDYVRLSLEHLQIPAWALSKCSKLRGKYFGSFPVVAVHSPIAIEVRLPAWLHANVHPVFHPMYLKPASNKSVDGGLRTKLQSVFEPKTEGVQGILAHRLRKGGTEFLVQWEGCSYLQSTWEPEAGLAGAQRHLTAYAKKSRKVEVSVCDVLMNDPRRTGEVIQRVPLCAAAA